MHALLFLLAACVVDDVAGSDDTGWADTGSPAYDEVRSDVPREAEPDDSDVAELVAGINGFGTDLYALLAADSSEDLALSPLSIEVALAMTRAGARGETAAQIDEALRFTLEDERLHAAMDALALGLEARPDAGVSQEIAPEIALANSLWGQVGYGFETDFLDLLARWYGAGMNLVDFAGDAEGARAAINGWVADRTHDLIPELLPAGAVSELTRLVLVNTVYFAGAWDVAFPEEATAPAAFTALDGSSTTVEMMHLDGQELPWGAGDGWQAVAIPVDGQQFSLVVVLPDEGRFTEVEAGLDAAFLAEVDAAMAATPVDLALPRFAVDTPVALNDALRSLGMVDAFDPGLADFTGMSGSGELYIGRVQHEARVEVDENGIVAAAGTAVVMDGTAEPEDAVAVTADRPFLWYLRDEPTGAVLFLGRVVAPS